MTSLLVDRDRSPPRPGLHQILGLNVRLKAVDVGANPIDGDPPYAGLLRAGVLDVVGFEPNPTALAELNQKKGPHETYLPHPVGDGGRATLRVCALQGMTSLLQPNMDVLSLFYGFPEWGQVVEEVELDTVRLDDMAETAGMDMLKIDIQGGELMVFRNAPERLANALLIHTEVEFLPMYLGQPLFADVDAFLRSQGYMIHRFEPMIRRDIAPVLLSPDPNGHHSQLMWADAIYVRDLTKLEALTSEQVLKLAVLLHDCYRSYDVVYYLMRELDRRTGVSWSETYLAALEPN